MAKYRYCRPILGTRKASSYHATKSFPNSNPFEAFSLKKFHKNVMIMLLWEDESRVKCL
jgi:hypothetical protein